MILRLVITGLLAAVAAQAAPVIVGMPGTTVRCFPLSVPLDRTVDGNSVPQEEGTVQFFWNEQELIVEAVFHDSDIIAKGEADQLQHNELGDVLEIFLQPPGKTYYWELFVTPKGYQSCLFWDRTVSREWDKTPARRIHLDCQILPLDEGSPGWKARVRIPFSDLTKLGDRSPAEVSWRTLVARQNFTGEVRKECRELSSFPLLEKTNFHATNRFVELNLKKENKE